MPAKHCDANREHIVDVEVPADVHIQLHDRLGGGAENTAGLLVDEAWTSREAPVDFLAVVEHRLIPRSEWARLKCEGLAPSMPGLITCWGMLGLGGGQRAVLCYCSISMVL